MPVTKPACRRALPLLSSSESAPARAGGTLFLARLVHHMGPDLAAYALLLVLPLLPCMSDPAAPTREAAAATFASLVAVLPISMVGPPPPPSPAAGVQLGFSCAASGMLSAADTF